MQSAIASASGVVGVDVGASCRINVLFGLWALRITQDCVFLKGGRG